VAYLRSDQSLNKSKICHGQHNPLKLFAIEQTYRGIRSQASGTPVWHLRWSAESAGFVTLLIVLYPTHKRVRRRDTFVKVQQSHVICSESNGSLVGGPSSDDVVMYSVDINRVRI
jgi:hypothetical protein